VRACLDYGTFVPRGSGQQVRDFIFVGDVVDLYLRIGEQLARNAATLRGRVYNAGTNQPRAVRDVLETVYRLTNRERDFGAVLEMMKGRETVGEIECQYMDYELVNRDFGWSPQHSFDAGVSATIEWFRGYLKYKYAS
jgi:nucleoside-diphosphate-sugar epimerase